MSVTRRRQCAATAAQAGTEVVGGAGPCTPAAPHLARAACRTPKPELLQLILEALPKQPEQTTGETNGLSNGHSNGVSDGHADGVSNGHANGVSNGYANGVSNGYADGRPRSSHDKGSPAQQVQSPRAPPHLPHCASKRLPAHSS